MLFGMRPASLCSPTHQIIGGFWNMLSAVAAAPWPGHDVQTGMRGKVDVDFSSIFVRCKFLRSWVWWLVEEGWGGGDPAVWCPELVNPNLIWYARSKPTLMCTGRRCQVQRVERAPFVYERSGAAAALTHFGLCPSTTVRMRSGLLKGPLSSPAHMNTSWEAESNTNLFFFSPNTQSNWRNVWNFHVVLREPSPQFMRQKLHDNLEYINEIVAGFNLLLYLLF